TRRTTTYLNSRGKGRRSVALTTSGRNTLGHKVRHSLVTGYATVEGGKENTRTSCFFAPYRTDSTTLGDGGMCHAIQHRERERSAGRSCPLGAVDAVKEGRIEVPAPRGQDVYAWRQCAAPHVGTETDSAPAAVRFDSLRVWPRPRRETMCVGSLSLCDSNERTILPCGRPPDLGA